MISASFGDFLEKYPVSPYLGCRDDLVKWTFFIHNKINKKLEKKQLTLTEFYTNYYKQYETVPEKQRNFIKNKKKIVFASIVILVCIMIFVFYKK